MTVLKQGFPELQIQQTTATAAGTGTAATGPTWDPFSPGSLFNAAASGELSEYFLVYF